MLLTENQLRKIVKRVILENWGGDWGDFVPTGPDDTTVAGLSKDAYSPHAILAMISIVDPTMIADVLDALVYCAEGNYESAALV